MVLRFNILIISILVLFSSCEDNLEGYHRSEPISIETEATIPQFDTMELNTLYSSFAEWNNVKFQFKRIQEVVNQNSNWEAEFINTDGGFNNKLLFSFKQSIFETQLGYFDEGGVRIEIMDILHSNSSRRTIPIWVFIKKKDGKTLELGFNAITRRTIIVPNMPNRYEEESIWFRTVLQLP